MKLSKKISHMGRSLLIAAVLAAGASGVASATETCPSNVSGPDICVDWDQGGTPDINTDFTVDYITDPSNPTVTLKRGATWNVRSKNADETPGNIGDIKIDATVVSDSFGVTIANGANPGAANVGEILLDDSDPNWTGNSSLGSGSSITGNLTDGATVIQSGLSGGDLDLTVGGDINGPINAFRIENLDITGSLNAGVDAEGVITAMDVGQDVTANITGANITSLHIGGNLTANINCTGRITYADIDGSVSGDVGSLSGNIWATTITDLSIGSGLTGGAITATDVTELWAFGGLDGSTITAATVWNLHVYGGLVNQSALDIGQVMGETMWPMVKIYGVIDATSGVTIQEIQGDGSTLALHGSLFGHVEVGLLTDGADIEPKGPVEEGSTITVTQIEPGGSPNLSVIDVIGNTFAGTLTLGNGIPEKGYSVISSSYTCRCSGPFLTCLIRCLYGVGSMATAC